MKRWDIVVDSVTSGPYEGIIGLAWETPHTIRAVVTRNGECVRTVLELVEH
jgi:hypothetical protein